MSKEPRLTDLQLDALRELANIASGHAATALAQMLGTEVDLSVPGALALPRAQAIASYGSADGPVAAVVTPVEGDIEGVVLLLIPSGDAETLCRLLGVVPRSEVGDSALREIGNILGASYLNALSAITGLELAPCPPRLTTDGPAAVFSSLAEGPADKSELVLVLDSVLHVAELPCSISFLLLPTAGGVSELLAPLGLAGGR
ncbi:MAG: chemotaxis protein CheC [Solirubrobacteraceae bacterium]